MSFPEAFENTHPHTIETEFGKIQSRSRSQNGHTDVFKKGTKRSDDTFPRPDGGDVAFHPLMRERRAQWEALALTGYRVPVECRGPWKFWEGTLVVTGGEVRELVEPNGDTLAGAELPADARTIDEFFGLIEKVLAEERLLYTRYDETTGHPRVIKIDWPDLAHDGGDPLFELGEVEPFSP